jgi:DNA-binding NarL/FixJ family response regulator
MIKIAITDDHKLFRRGMNGMVSDFEEIEVLFEAGTGQELLDELKNTSIDLVLLDLEMPEMDGIATTPVLRDQFPDVKIIILTMHDDDQMIAHLMELGAHGYLLKDAEPEEVETAIRTTIENGFYFNERVSKAMLAGLVQKKKIKPTFSHQTELSEREVEVLKLICQEFTSQEIADKLFISKRTVEGHRNRLLEKIGAKNTVGLVVFAAQHGML